MDISGISEAEQKFAAAGGSIGLRRAGEPSYLRVRQGIPVQIGRHKACGGGSSRSCDRLICRAAVQGTCVRDRLGESACVRPDQVAARVQVYGLEARAGQGAWGQGRRWAARS